MLIEYRYKHQSSCRSFVKCKNKNEIINWLKRFQNNTLENDNADVKNIEEIRITLKDDPFVVWIQMVRKIWGNWEVSLIINDFPIGSIFSYKDVMLFLEKFIEIEDEDKGK